MKFCYSGWILAALLTTLVASAELKLIATPGNPESVYRRGDQIVFNFRLTDDQKPVANQALHCVIERECGEAAEISRLVTDSNGRAVATTAATSPGCVRARATVLNADGKFVRQTATKGGEKNSAPVTKLIGAMVEPESLCDPFPEPADFDAFWDRARAELAATPLAVLKCEEFKAQKNSRPGSGYRPDKVRCFDLQLAAPGPRVASGILAVPTAAKPKSLPAVLFLHGAGVRSAVERAFIAYELNALVLDLNAHGLPNLRPADYYLKIKNGELKDYIYWVALQPPETNYFKYMYLRALRALEYLKSRPEWNGQILAVNGGSQGGAQAIAVAGLDPDVTFCNAKIPWLTVPAAPAAGRFQPRWPQLVSLAPDAKSADAEVIRRLGYFDNAHFARRARAVVAISYGLADEICPPSGVWMTYNNFKNARSIIGAPAKGHGSLGLPDALSAYLKRQSR